MKVLDLFGGSLRLPSNGTGYAERRACVCMWNGALRDEVRPTEPGISALIEQTAGLSYVYLKELFRSAMTKSLASPGQGAMNAVTVSAVGALREPMAASPPDVPAMEMDRAGEDGSADHTQYKSRRFVGLRRGWR